MQGVLYANDRQIVRKTEISKIRVGYVEQQGVLLRVCPCIPRRLEAL